MKFNVFVQVCFKTLMCEKFFFFCRSTAKPLESEVLKVVVCTG